MRCQLVAASALLIAATAACSEGQAQDAGPAVGRSYQVGSFTGIEVAGPFDVQVSTGKPVSVSARGPEKLLDAMEVKVEGGKLVIRPQRKGWFNGMSWRSAEKAVFTISVPALSSAEVMGSGEIAIDRVSGQQFEGGIAGSGHLNLQQVAVQELKLEIAGSGEVTAAGQAQRAAYEIAGSGNLDASRVNSVDASAEIAGSGNIRARATASAKASIVGSGDIEISGGAKCQISKTGSGNVRCS